MGEVGPEELRANMAAAMFLQQRILEILKTVAPNAVAQLLLDTRQYYLVLQDRGEEGTPRFETTERVLRQIEDAVGDADENILDDED